MTKARSLEFIEWDDGSFTLQVADRPANIAREFPLDKESFDVAVSSLKKHLRPILPNEPLS